MMWGKGCKVGIACGRGSENIKGTVIKNISNLYEVSCNGAIFSASAVGKLKYVTGDFDTVFDKLLASRILVGDEVEFNITGSNEAHITQILPRKNALIRPPVANIEVLLILLSVSPAPDFLLIDKLIIMCKVNNITPILCVNKIELADKKFLKEISEQYENTVEIVEISAQNKTNFNKLLPLIYNKIVAVAGQSAVGKSTLINALLNTNIKTGELSKKVDRGKHTTRHTQIYISDSIKIADTPGFSLIDLNIASEELRHYYAEFKPFLCKYGSCSHVSESKDICGVKAAAEQGKINAERYNRYAKLYNEIKKAEERKYK